MNVSPCVCKNTNVASAPSGSNWAQTCGPGCPCLDPTKTCVNGTCLTPGAVGPIGGGGGDGKGFPGDPSGLDGGPTGPGCACEGVGAACQIWHTDQQGKKYLNKKECVKGPVKYWMKCVKGASKGAGAPMCLKYTDDVNPPTVYFQHPCGGVIPTIGADPKSWMPLCK